MRPPRRRTRDLRAGRGSGEAVLIPKEYDGGTPGWVPIVAWLANVRTALWRRFTSLRLMAVF